MRRRALALFLLALPLGAGALLCLLQLVPLPPGLLAVLSPEAAGLLARICVDCRGARKRASFASIASPPARSGPDRARQFDRPYAFINGVTETP